MTGMCARVSMRPLCLLILCLAADVQDPNLSTFPAHSPAAGRPLWAIKLKGNIKVSPDAGAECQCGSLRSKITSNFSPIRSGTAVALGIGSSVGEELKARRLDMFST